MILPEKSSPFFILSTFISCFFLHFRIFFAGGLISSPGAVPFGAFCIIFHCEFNLS